MSGSPAEPVTQAELEVADTVGRLMEFWGFKRPMGRMWTLLYLSPAPLGAAELGEQLKMSAGAVSMTLNELLKWGAVKKSWRPGERRDFYEAETSIGKLVQRVLRERELELVRQFADALSNAEAALPRPSETALVPDFKRTRVHELQRLSKLGETLLTALVAGKVVDPTRFPEGVRRMTSETTALVKEGSGAMFDGIAARYDLVNRVISLGVDQSWRRKTVRALNLANGHRVLDLATGTADLAIQVARSEPGVRVVGLDPSSKMLEVGRSKVARGGLEARVELVQGDAQSLPFEPNSFDSVCIAFGIRNVPDRGKALCEMARVTRPGGRIAILELSEPRSGLLGALARFHIHAVVPYVGALLSGVKEYQYLQRSIAAFPQASEFAALMKSSNLDVVEVHALTFGVCHLYVAAPGEAGVSEHVELGAPSSRIPDAFDPRELLARIEHTLGQVEDDGRCVVLTWAVPRVPSERLLGAAAEGDALLWAPPGEGEICALGAAFILTASGPDRFQIIQQRAREVWPLLDLLAADRAAPEPRFFGGFAFQPGQAQSKVWADFGDARFVLPRLSYLKNPQGAWLRLIVRAADLSRSEFRAELSSLFGRAVRALFTVTSPVEPARELTREERSPEAWAELLADIQREIASGRAQKIVAARRVSLTLDRELLPAVVQSRLRDDAPESTRFAFRVENSTFLGATPERLIRKRGTELTTEAVAGSTSTGDAASASRLLESGKDSREHEFVVSELLRLLGPLTTDLSPGKREVHRLRTVLHLRTPISGRLREASHVLDLVGKLHPTPAVGGVPTAAAIDFITRHEPDERGWYAGPVGWFDAAGDGRFVVALRSGVVTGNHAELYAGAGIVRDSNAPSEFAETRWKLAALLGALGVSA